MSTRFSDAPNSQIAEDIRKKCGGRRTMECVEKDKMAKIDSRS